MAMKSKTCHIHKSYRSQNVITEDFCGFPQTIQEIGPLNIPVSLNKVGAKRANRHIRISVSLTLFSRLNHLIQSCHIFCCYSQFYIYMYISLMNGQFVVTHAIRQTEIPALLDRWIVLYCGRVPAANAPGCTAAEGLLYKPRSLVVPTCTARCLHQRP